MTQYWFKPKTYGYGAAPTSWQGWAVVAAFVAATVVISVSFMVWPVLRGTGPSVPEIAAWLGFMAVAIIALVRLCRAKTDGEWRWRWGGKDA